MSSVSANWSQVVAVYFAVRCCLFVCLVPLSTLLAVYLFSKLSCMTLISNATTFFATKWMRQLIIKSAPTKQKGNEAIQSTRVWVPLGIFLTNVVAMRSLAAISILKPILTWSPALSFAVTVRLAVASVLLGLTVVSRFVGPPSVVRCSSSPLYINPFTQFLRQKLSLGAILKFAAPSDLPKQPYRDLSLQRPMQPGHETALTSTSEQRQTNPRRLQQPTIVAISAQVFLSITIAAVVACISVVPLAPVETKYGAQRQLYLIMHTIVGTFLQLILTTLDGTSHELNPQRYQARFGWKNLYFSAQQSYMSLFPALIVIPAVASYAALSYEESFIYGITAMGTMLYLQAFDFALLCVLCTTPPDLKRLVEQASGEGGLDVFMDVVLESVLHSNDDLVKKLIGTPSGSALNTLEREEQILNETVIAEMANTLLYKTLGDEMGPRLEADILRLAILASVGAPAVEGVGCGHDCNHVRNIKQWMTTFSPKPNTGIAYRPEPYAVPLLRSLCAYVGGLGNALMVIAVTKQLTSGEWLLAPGTLVCAEYAIRGATRFILSGFSDTNETPMKGFGSTYLATFVPVLLNSTYRLECGLVRYVQWFGGLNPTPDIDKAERLELLTSFNPQLLPLFNVCYECANLVLEKIKPSEGLRQDGFHTIDISCQKWINGILMTSPQR